ncbi:MAG: alternative oxidase [Actinomycetota bacterium]
MTIVDPAIAVDPSDLSPERPPMLGGYRSAFSIPNSPMELRQHQQRYLDEPAYRYGLPARLLFWAADKAFPQGRSFEFFAFVELVARVPYMAWEHVAHIAQTQTHRDHRLGRKIQDRVFLARDEQDNEFWHLLIMEEFLEAEGYERRWFLDRVFPQVLSFVYYQLSWLLFVVRPKWSYRLNSDFEDHAMRQYARFVEEHPEFDETVWQSDYREEYGFHVTVGDMLRQIARDEEQHKEHSEDFIRRGARFSRDKG